MRRLDRSLELLVFEPRDSQLVLRWLDLLGSRLIRH